MKEIDRLFQIAKKQYDNGNPSLEACFDVGRACFKKLSEEATLRKFGVYKGSPIVTYYVAETSENLSRPYRPDIYISESNTFDDELVTFISQATNKDIKNANNFECVAYTIVTSFCLCYDLWKPKSRKTPGTFFEVLVGSLCFVRYPSPNYVLSKHIRIENSVKSSGTDEEKSGTLKGDSVSTDLVISNTKNSLHAVIPLKITTRERIVQPFAHQRILDSAYPNQYKSFLTCISEVQRDDKTSSVKQICVPGTVALFQKHLAKLGGLYYCDIPQRYAKADFNALIKVAGFACLFDDIDEWLNYQT